MSQLSRLPRRLRLRLVSWAGLLALILASLPGVLNPPAYAAQRTISGSMAMSGGVLWSECQDVPYTWNYVYEAEARSPFFTAMYFTLTSPDGDVETDFVMPKGTSSGQSTFSVCGDSSAPGTWVLTGYIRTLYLGSPEVIQPLAAVSVTFTDPATLTSLIVGTTSVKHGSILQVRTRSQLQIPTGYQPLTSQTSIVQIYKGAGWVSIAEGYTNSLGDATVELKVRSKKSMTIRALTPVNDSGAESASEPVTLKVTMPKKKKKKKKKNKPGGHHKSQAPKKPGKSAKSKGDSGSLTITCTIINGKQDCHATVGR